MFHIRFCKHYHLQRAWKNYKASSQLQGFTPDSKPSHLLLFYAVESGLKDLFVSENRLKECPEGGLLYSHDLKKLLLR